MPLYEYECETCNTRFERIERASAPSAGVCPSCQGHARRLLGTPALKFKGTGWYVTDYGKDAGSSPTASADASRAETSGARTKPTSSANSTAASDSKVA